MQCGTAQLMPNVLVAMFVQGSAGSSAAASSEVFNTPITNFYMTDPISRSSQTMAKCTGAATVAVATLPTWSIQASRHVSYIRDS